MTGDVYWGGIPEVLCREASDATMLALGKRGSGSKKDALMLGRNFCSVIAKVRLPVLVGGDEERTLRQIFFIEKGRTDIYKTLPSVARLNQSFPDGVTGLVIQKNKAILQAGLAEIMTEFHKYNISDYFLIGHRGWSVPEIVASTCEHSADLIVIRRDRYLSIIKWLTGSTLEDLISAARLPMLLIQEYGLIHANDIEL
jgi:nucleotide-binding universal stress UspA family protein